MDCIFCKIVEGELPSNKVFESDRIVAFHNIKLEAPVHILFIPKKHVPSMNDITAEDAEAITEIHLAFKKVAKDLGVDETGYRIINNCGNDGGQLVPHLHYHLLGGEKLGPLNRT
ncbi:histidine triad nucleotide-binding protein [Chengkuizengella axinellae]|uniref:Histidine triad nucleotide-binding protein n=1 Tax=Chengkuizengella axinellae TaxID=3064388 RepID=A0ABT9IUU7_9BACL|nr:histidine triad nucleotide-binding protein [Chengkuizengella sp. 2205SS18-9]MDP5273087.1 histidine triad nucleotide-binding protein [Chengkuizengella sp. 2205SS18-9]